MPYYIPSPAQVRAEKEKAKANEINCCLARAAGEFTRAPRLPFTCKLEELAPCGSLRPITRDKQTLAFVRVKFKTMLEEMGWVPGDARVAVTVSGLSWPFTPKLHAYLYYPEY